MVSPHRRLPAEQPARCRRVIGELHLLLVPPSLHSIALSNIPCSLGVTTKIIVLEDAASAFTYINTFFAILIDTVTAQGWIAFCLDQY